MGRIIADTSALVSFGTVRNHEQNPLVLLFDEYQVIVPEQVVSELRETASYEDQSGDAAQAVLNHRSGFDVRCTELDETFPLDDGENAAITLANDLDATQLLCDEFNRLALIHASLADTRLVTTPSFLTLLVRNEFLSPSEAEDLLSIISGARSWDTNSYVARATTTLQREQDSR